VNVVIASSGATKLALGMMAAGWAKAISRRASPSIHCRQPEVLAVLDGEPRRMGPKRLRPSFETPRKCTAPQDDGSVWCEGWWRAIGRALRNRHVLTFHYRKAKLLFN
jgi:hypothetical protein